MPTKEEVKAACDLLNHVIENAMKDPDLATYAARQLSATTVMSLEGLRSKWNGPNLTPQINAQ